MGRTGQVGRPGRPVTRRGLLLGAVGAGALTVWAAPAAVAHVPEVVDCAGWAARPPAQPVRVVAQRPVRILVHHTATPNVEDLSREAADRLARGIQDFHMDARGWLDSGQHFTISRGGVVLEGRSGSLDALRRGDRTVEGAHCRGQNLESVGIENEGTYTGAGPPGPLWERLRALCAELCTAYGIAPTAIAGHREFADTLCPGDVLHGLLPQLRGEVAELVGARTEGAATAPPSWPLLRPDDRGPLVRTAQHLLRAAGHDVVVDGGFGPALEAAVRAFQAAHATEEVTGLIGGETWPLLTAPRRGAEAEPDDGLPPRGDDAAWKAHLAALAP